MRTSLDKPRLRLLARPWVRITLYFLGGYIGLVLMLLFFENRLIYHPTLAGQHWLTAPHADIQDIELARRLAVSGLGIVPLNAHTFSVSLPTGGLVALKTRRSLGLHESVYLITKKRVLPHPTIERLLQSV